MGREYPVHGPFTGNVPVEAPIKDLDDAVPLCSMATNSMSEASTAHGSWQGRKRALGRSDSRGRSIDPFRAKIYQQTTIHERSHEGTAELCGPPWPCVRGAQISLALFCGIL